MRIAIHCWQMIEPTTPLRRAVHEISTERLTPGEALVRVAGCGVCHTDLSFLYGGVRTNRELPLTLGHEVSGIVLAQGGGLERLIGKSVIVPAVLPCGDCELCQDGYPNICRKQVFPGNDVDGGFASHVIVPGKFLCTVDPDRLAGAGLELADLSVIADAVSTAYQAVHRAKVGPKDVAVFVGVGGVGAFAAQIARAAGAHVVAIDVDPARLETIRAAGVEETIDVTRVDARDLREKIRAFAKQRGLASTRWRIFETSGTAAGQLTAFSLLTHGAMLTFVGYTRDAVSVRLSNLMAFDAVARGTWACDPALYPEVLELVLSGKVQLGPFVERRPMGRVNETIDELRQKSLRRRPILIPDFEEAA